MDFMGLSSEKKNKEFENLKKFLFPSMEALKEAKIEDILEVASYFAVDYYSGYQKFKITEAGRVVLGTAYTHEKNAYYPYCGLELRYETTLIICGEEIITNDIGLFPLYVQTDLESYIVLNFPIGFTELFNAYSYSNGIGDEVKLIAVIKNADEVANVSKGFDFAAYEINN